MHIKFAANRLDDNDLMWTADGDYYPGQIPTSFGTPAPPPARAPARPAPGQARDPSPIRSVRADSANRTRPGNLTIPVTATGLRLRRRNPAFRASAAQPGSVPRGPPAGPALAAAAGGQLCGGRASLRVADTDQLEIMFTVTVTVTVTVTSVSATEPH